METLKDYLLRAEANVCSDGERDVESVTKTILAQLSAIAC